MNKLIALLIAGLSLILLTACEDKEMDDLARAQECLNKVGDTNHTAARECFDMVAGHDSQQANMIKCSAKFLEGGLTTAKVVEATKQIQEEGGGDKKELMFIGFLALTPLTAAEEAATYCRRSEVAGYIYLGDLAVVASVLREVSSTLPGGDFGDTPTQANLEAVLDACKVTPLPAACRPEVLAPAVISVANSYCSKPSADEDKVCNQIEATLAEAGDNQEVITQALSCFLNGQTYTVAGGCQ